MKPEFLPGNRLTLLDSGREYFPALLAAIAAAEREIYLETYIFAADAVGEAVCAALCAAAARGVVVGAHQGAQTCRIEAAAVRQSAKGTRAMISCPGCAVSRRMGVDKIMPLLP